MKLEYSKSFEDIKFLLSFFNKEIICEEINEGIILRQENNVYDTIDSVLSEILSLYGSESNEKTLREAKRLRLNPEVRKVELSVASLLSFFGIYKQVIEGGNLKNKEFVDNMCALIKPHMLIDPDFQLLDIQLGQITEIDFAPELDKLYIEKVEARRKMVVLSGLREHVQKEELLNGKFLFVTNMKPVKFKGLASEGMILCTKDTDGKVEVIKPSQMVAPGTRLELEGYSSILSNFTPSQVDMKKSTYSNALQSFKVIGNYLTFKGVKVLCGGEYIRTVTSDGPVS